MQNAKKDDPTLNNLQVHLPARKVVDRTPTDVPQNKKTPEKKKLVFRAVGIIVFLGIFTASVYAIAPEKFLNSWNKSDVQVNSSQDTPKNEMDIILEEVGKQYLLPVGEIPTIALVTSLDDIKTQPFFAKAEVGDVVLMYLEAKKGILWRPKTRQIIEVGPLSIKDTPPTASTTPSTP